MDQPDNLVDEDISQSPNNLKRKQSAGEPSTLIKNLIKNENILASSPTTNGDEGSSNPSRSKADPKVWKLIKTNTNEHHQEPPTTLREEEEDELREAVSTMISDKNLIDYFLTDPERILDFHEDFPDEKIEGDDILASMELATEFAEKEDRSDYPDLRLPSDLLDVKFVYNLGIQLSLELNIKTFDYTFLICHWDRLRKLTKDNLLAVIQFHHTPKKAVSTECLEKCFIMYYRFFHTLLDCVKGAKVIRRKDLLKDSKLARREANAEAARILKSVKELHCSEKQFLEDIKAEDPGFEGLENLFLDSDFKPFATMKNLFKDPFDV